MCLPYIFFPVIEKPNPYRTTNYFDPFVTATF